MPDTTYPLFAGHPPHVAGSATSRDAATAILPSVGSLQAMVLGIVRAAGDAGITCDGIEEAAGGRHQSISARVRELALRGLIRDSGRTRATRSGRKAVVWVEGGNHDEG